MLLVHPVGLCSLVPSSLSHTDSTAPWMLLLHSSVYACDDHWVNQCACAVEQRRCDMRHELLTQRALFCVGVNAKRAC